MKSSERIRRRWELAVAVLLVVSAGLASRRFPFLLPAAWGNYPGDALWTMMVLFGLAFLFPRIAPLKAAALALVISYAVEFSQLYQGGWLQEFRSYRLGQLALGSGFDWLDLVAYPLGATAGYLADVLLLFRAQRAKAVAD